MVHCSAHGSSVATISTTNCLIMLLNAFSQSTFESACCVRPCWSWVTMVLAMWAMTSRPMLERPFWVAPNTLCAFFLSMVVIVPENHRLMSSPVAMGRPSTVGSSSEPSDFFFAPRFPIQKSSPTHCGRSPRHMRVINRVAHFVRSLFGEHSMACLRR